MPASAAAAAAARKIGRQLRVGADGRGDPVGERLLASHDRGRAQMQPPAPLGPQVVIDGLADQQMRERDHPARRRVLLDQQTCPLRLVERRGRLGRAGHGGRIGQGGMITEHRRGHHQVARRPRAARPAAAG